MGNFETFKEDIIELPPDYEGEVRAVLLSKRADAVSTKAVLYIHGYSDYFFNTELADFYLSLGYDFYAIDLRKYGRSLLKHQHTNFCKDLTEYYQELDEVIKIIKERDSHKTLIINAHSTGGLLAALYAHDRRESSIIDGLILNSPWFDINEPIIIRKILLPILLFVGKHFPFVISPKGLDPNAAKSTNKDILKKQKINMKVYEDGHWDFNMSWKSGFNVYTGFIRAVRMGQFRLYKGLNISCPVYLLCSDKKGKATFRLKEQYFNSDCVLNPEHMINNIDKLGDKTECSVINDGIHDLALSQKKVRENYYDKITKWLNKTSI